MPFFCPSSFYNSAQSGEINWKKKKTMIAASGFLHFAQVEIKKLSENNYKKMAGMQIYILEA